MKKTVMFGVNNYSCSEVMVGTMVVWAVVLSSKEYKIRKVVSKKLIVFKWNYQSLIIGVMANCQNLDTILQNEMI